MYIMSKARSMYAGSSGFNYGVNKNSPGNGNGKWQGLWPSVGHARNTRLINTRAGGDNRNVVFCMNQLGGVGRKSNMFATTADGVKQPCPGSDNKPWWVNNKKVVNAVILLDNYIKSKTNNKAFLAYIGDHETVKEDKIDTTSGYNPNDDSWAFKPFVGSDIYNIADPETRAAAELLNTINVKGPVNGQIMPHEVGIVGNNSQQALVENYGLKIKLAESVLVKVFTDGCVGGDYKCRSSDNRLINTSCGTCSSGGACVYMGTVPGSRCTSDTCPENYNPNAHYTWCGCEQCFGDWVARATEQVLGPVGFTPWW